MYGINCRSRDGPAWPLSTLHGEVGGVGVRVRVRAGLAVPGMANVRSRLPAAAIPHGGGCLIRRESITDLDKHPFDPCCFSLALVWGNKR